MDLSKVCLLISCLILNVAIAVSAGSCDQLWSYNNDKTGRYGVIRINRPDYKMSAMRAVMSVAAQLAQKNTGSLKLLKSIDATVSDISQGLPVFYRVNFPIQNPVPNIVEIYYNDQLLCSAPKVTGNFVTTITLDHNFITGLKNPPLVVQPEQIRPVSQQFAAQKPKVPITTRKSARPPPVQPSASADFECGVPDYKEPTTTGLIIRGMDVKRGQFPWLAAMYYSPQNEVSGYICSGSLVSRKVVVTAAHCVQRKEDNEASRIQAEEILFYFGKNNLQSNEAEQGNIVSAVSNVHVHPDWNYRTQDYDADISIAVLSRTMVFNTFVKPICLWTSTQSFDDIVGVKGVVAGWGIDENKVISHMKPKWARIPVVTAEVCLRSDATFITLTSDRTFCAGETFSNRIGGSGPCNGDSGGGFVVKNGNKWYLRGIISSAIADPESGTCDPEKYSVFTDTTKFTSWMQYYISYYG